MKLHLYISVTLAASLASVPALHGEEFGGVEFSQGEKSFADQLVAYEPDFSGGAVPTEPTSIDPNSALGVPDHSGGGVGVPGAVSLGSGGRLILRFTNNALTGSNDDSPDLHVFEVGPDVEDTFVDISRDGSTWHSVGKVHGATSSIDIDAFGFNATDQFYFVRLTDDPEDGNTGGSTVGADIDAVGAISTEAVEHTPEVTIRPAVVLEFQTATGSTYVIEESADLEVWQESVAGIRGDGSVQKFFFEATAAKTFYRVKPVVD
ncbi:MAG: hypothetical protein WD490_09340 [Opitutales bacterium]